MISALWAQAVEVAPQDTPIPNPLPMSEVTDQPSLQISPRSVFRLALGAGSSVDSAGPLPLLPCLGRKSRCPLDRAAPPASQGLSRRRWLLEALPCLHVQVRGWDAGEVDPHMLFFP